MSTDELAPKTPHKQEITHNATLLFRLQKVFEDFNLEDANTLNIELQKMQASGKLIAPTVDRLWTNLVLRIDYKNMKRDAA